ncbi:hypothetical protein Pyn_36665 [Prunus yedoensis var. nudiflora]|uniref:Uncharacterized protein n=1 Tax=Prunus yedoensis var. nudiflora TaxID=2094558 RepID=A0A314YQ97_PRUYE|nr:hypothetical protein Pyn_36665 [Prunus yedoensis var. nudiflora]
MNLWFGMMTLTIPDMAALFDLYPIGVEVNTALMAPKVEGSFEAAWHTVAMLVARKVKNMLIYSIFYNSFGVKDDAENGSYAPFGKFIFCGQANKVTLEFSHLADYLA